jgi:hypothetical protein
MKRFFNYIANLTKAKGLWYTIYYITIGFVIGVIVKAWNGVKSLGWFYGFIAFAISSLLFFSPTILGAATFFITGNGWFLGLATGYFWWVVAPTGSSLLYAFIVTGTIPIVKFFKDRLSVKIGR